jgi:hypothetical protein
LRAYFIAKTLIINFKIWYTIFHLDFSLLHTDIWVTVILSGLNYPPLTNICRIFLYSSCSIYDRDNIFFNYIHACTCAYDNFCYTDSFPLSSVNLNLPQLCSIVTGLNKYNMREQVFVKWYFILFADLPLQISFVEYKSWPYVLVKWCSILLQNPFANFFFSSEYRDNVVSRSCGCLRICWGRCQVWGR